ncbi:MAG: hypothetical protein IMW89_22565, partial [Ktedonobacteraceae bacterium]|nr:hypothetical protein [Ktedonobacteraceae bacterium]
WSVVLASWLGGLIVALINIAFDLAAYYAHWWHYSLDGLILHLPLPFYITSFLVFGSLVFLLIWRFWRARRWLALLLLIGVPLFGIARDSYGGLSQRAYTQWENIPLALLMTIIMWLVMFYAGFLVFKRLAPERPAEEAGSRTPDRQNAST